MNWLTPPEITMSGCAEGTFSIELATKLFTPVSADDDQCTLLNPENVFEFEYHFENEEWSVLAGCGLTQEQATCLYSYGKQQIQYNTYQAYGNLVTKTVNESIEPLMGISFDLTSRVAVYYNVLGGLDCSHYFTAAIPNDEARVNSICVNFDFYDIDTISYFLNWPWYQYTDYGD